VSVRQATLSRSPGGGEAPQIDAGEPAHGDSDNFPKIRDIPSPPRLAMSSPLHKMRDKSQTKANKNSGFLQYFK
jgi:hypothetical protein